MLWRDQASCGISTAELYPPHPETPQSPGIRGRVEYTSEATGGPELRQDEAG